MNAERTRDFLLSLPHVVETEQWGGPVFWVGDKLIGGRMFVMLNLEQGQLPISYAAGRERYHELLEVEGIIPAPYLARAFWVGVDRWELHRTAEWESELTAAHTLVYAKLPPKTLKVLALPRAEQKKLIAVKRKEADVKAS